MSLFPKNYYFSFSYTYGWLGNFAITAGGFPKLRGWGTTPRDRLHGGGVIWAEAVRPGAGNPLVSTLLIK